MKKIRRLLLKNNFKAILNGFQNVYIKKKKKKKLYKKD